MRAEPRGEQRGGRAVPGEGPWAPEPRTVPGYPWVPLCVNESWSFKRGLYQAVQAKTNV